MKLLPLSLSVVVAIAVGRAATHAADLGVRPAYSPPPPLPPAYSWTGFYLGANGGFGGDKFQYPFSIGGPIPALGIPAATSGTSTLNSSGFFGGGQAGFNWQAGSAWVLGVESDFDGADIEGKAATSATLFSGSVGTKLDWFGTVRGRVGFLVTPSALLYGTGGWAYGHTTNSANAAAFGLAVPARSATRRMAGPLAPVSNTPLPSRPGELHPESLTDPDVILWHHPARATMRRLPPSIDDRVPPAAG
jgi:outer membrane immunogenic protein